MLFGCEVMLIESREAETDDRATLLAIRTPDSSLMLLQRVVRLMASPRPRPSGLLDRSSARAAWPGSLMAGRGRVGDRECKRLRRVER